MKGGDRIFLMDGYHGAVLIRDQRFTSPVMIAPVPGQTAHVESIQMRNTANVVVQELKVWATSSSAGAGTLVRTYGDTADIAFLDLDVRSVADAANYMQWNSSTWFANKRNGFLIDGNRNTVARSRITGLYHGLQGLGTNVLLEDNIIDGFSGDGMRALGDNSIVRNNKVQNCFQINGNHADGFQSFSRGADGKVGTGTVRNLLIENNKLFEWTSTATNPLRCKLQGIGMFDGMFDGILIRNNLITSSAYHGITIAGALNSTVVNNTVLRPDGSADKAPWILIGYHKNGTPSKNTTVANNLVTRINTKPDATNNVVVTNNIEVTNSANEFTSVATQNFTLKSSALAIDAGTAKLAPPSDIVGGSRPKGKAPDAGAYENF
ncbi:right-handed parallel beta-helix repeat-containing protein [Defluviimonas sp. D31]|uniref:right-handed parallel beta-helix repeat-containing protein n=1 Tax=Defluviimonas sp. D31 TaxID=3083253 RepID=UPI00296E511F|nr:right-handed parallel beta-helix repeat-containing protein [Defluviimonas sp. D31]MDW4550096.1 right-handed parallel beta-helix repeat-containing protein [Defluviimonas sp. D31]